MPGPRPDDDAHVGAVFSALADPTRRAVLRAVADQGQATATDLGLAVGVTRQAAAKHLDLLAAAGLVIDERAGRERRWRVTTEPLADAAAWLTAAGQAWDTRLARLVEAAAAEVVATRADGGTSPVP
ncbi:MAG TPA: metalloregulator ArsR/SmtB family transcription factor [Iamia sp.]|nr:metalloregulator ArsR/SmtB family transcription factor [Iamia sp.]